MSRLDEIAPRLGLAYRQEKVYQERLAFQRRRGFVTLDMAQEELVRTLRGSRRQMQRNVQALAESIRSLGRIAAPSEANRP